MNLEAWRNWHRGDHALVVAPGPSSLKVPLERYHAHWTIGVNRALPYCVADFAVCIEPSPKRSHAWNVVRACDPPVVFTHIEGAHPRGVIISTDLTDWLNPLDESEKLFLGMSPFYAAAVGIWLGFERIGIIGVDLERTHYPDPRYKETWEAAWTRLRAIAEELGCDLVNLNACSRLDAIRKDTWKTLRRRGE